MQIFTDSTGREWKLELNIGSVMAVKAKLDIDLFQADAGEVPLITRLGIDQLLLAEVILCLISDQIEKRDIRESEIRSCFDGNTIKASREAFYKELANFFLESGRPDLNRAMLKQEKILSTAIAKISSEMDAVDPDKLVAEGISAISGSSSGSTPEPSG